jgi:hypothetical protein
MLFFYQHIYKEADRGTDQIDLESDLSNNFLLAGMHPFKKETG